MTDLAELIQFTSLSQFKAAYLHVSDKVYLYEAGSGCIISANMSSHGLSEDPETGKSFFSVYPLISSRAADGFHRCEMKGADGAPSYLNVWISSVLVAGQGCKMAVVKKETITAPCREAEEAEKKALLNEVYHRVKNNLNIIVSLLSLQINRVSDPDTKHILKESKSRIYTLSLLQQNLYNSARISEIKAGNYLQSLALSVLSTFKSPEKQVDLKIQVEDHWLNLDTLVPLGLITHELVTNSVFHAFEHRQSGRIEVNFRRLNSGFFQLIIKDDGCGIPGGKTPEHFKTLGFQLVKSLVKQLRGNLSMESSADTGSFFMLEFKEVGK